MINEIIKTIRMFIFRFIKKGKPLKLILIDPNRVYVQDLKLLTKKFCWIFVRVNGIEDGLKVIDMGIRVYSKKP
jgi:hypothetical protein